MNNEDLSVSVRLELMGLKADLAEAKKLLTRNFSDATGKSIINLENKIKSLGSSVKSNNKEWVSSYKNLGTQVTFNQKEQAAYWDDYFRGNKNAVKMTEKISGKLRDMGQINKDIKK